MNEIDPSNDDHNCLQDTDHDTLLSMRDPWNLDTKSDSDSSSSSSSDDESSSTNDEADKDDEIDDDHVTDDEEQSLDEEQIDKDFEKTNDEELEETEHNREESQASDEVNEGENENEVNDKDDDEDDEEESDEGEDGEMYDLGESGYEPPTSSSVLRQELVEKVVRDQMKLFDTDEDENDMIRLRMEGNDTRQSSLMRSIMSDRSSVSLVGLLWQAVSQRMGGLSSILNSDQLQWLPPFMRSTIERRLSASSSSAVDGQQFNENDLFLKDYLAIERYRRDMGKFKNMRVVGADARLPTTSNMLIPSYQAKTTFEVSRRMRKHYD